MSGVASLFKIASTLATTIAKVIFVADSASLAGGKKTWPLIEECVSRDDLPLNRAAAD